MYVLRVSLDGSPGRSFCESVKLKSGLSWRPQHAGDDRDMRYLPKKDVNSEQNQPKRKTCVPVNRDEWSWRPEEYFNIRPGDAEFGVCLPGFQSCFGPVFSLYGSFPIFWNENI